jgi:hypothetical protein
MEIEKLKILRTLFPGTLILLGLLPAYVYFTKDPVEIGWTLAGVGMVISYGLGTIYNLYCLRKVFNWRSHERITDNIKQRLLKIGRTLPVTRERAEEILKTRSLMDIFYKLVDSDNTLKERAKLVRENGFAWGSIADVVVLGTVFAALYLPWWLATAYSPFLIMSLICGVAAIVGRAFLHPWAEKRHIRLGNEQLDFIELHLRQEAINMVNRL